MRPSRFSRKQLGLEQLEARDLMAGNVMVSVSGGILDIAGDAADNSVVVAFNPTSNKFEIHGRATTDGMTKINGFDTNQAGNVQSFSATHIRIRMKDGDDRLKFGLPTLPQVKINGWLNIQMGNGDDTVIAGQAGNPVGNATPVAASLDVAAAVVIFTDAGNDVLQMANFRGSRDVTINTGAGNDQVQFNTSFTTIGSTTPTNFPVQVGGNLAVQMGAGNDQLQGANLNASGDLRLRDSSGVTAVDLRSSYGARTVEVATSTGADEILLDGITTKFLSLNAGAGNDRVTLRHINARRLTASLEGGNDRLILGNVDVSQYTLLNGGDGNDVLVGESGNQLRGKVSRSF